jgi:hypothetical protein
MTKNTASGVTHDSHHLRLSYFYSTGHRKDSQIENNKLFQFPSFRLQKRQQFECIFNHFCFFNKTYSGHYSRYADRHQ